MASQEDCYFFFNSICTKGDDCAFRHERGALGQSVVCDQWKKGKCERNPCHFRHGTLETPRSSIPCYYENQPTGCLNYNCPYLHQKPRPVRPDHQFNEATQMARNSRPAFVPPRLNIPFPQRFVDPNMQQFRGPARPPHYSINVSPRKMQAIPQQTRFPSPDVRPAVFPSPPREPVRGDARDLRSRLVQEGERSSMNGPVAGEQHFAKGQQDVMNNPPSQLGPPIHNGQPILRTERTMSNVNHAAHRNDGPGLLGAPPVLPFPFGGIFPLTIVPEIMSHRSKDRWSGSSRRTVKKLDRRKHRKSLKSYEDRGERRLSQDSADLKRKKKEKRSKELKETAGEERKMKKDRVSSKTRKQEELAATATLSSVNEEEDVKEGDTGTAGEAILGFKVKTLEEILRDKALKKLRERQQEKEAVVKGDKSTSVGNTTSETEDSNYEPVVLTKDNNSNSSQMQRKNVPALKTKNEEKHLQNETTSITMKPVSAQESRIAKPDDRAKPEINSSVTCFGAGDRHVSSKELNLSTLKVNTSEEIRSGKPKQNDDIKEGDLNPVVIDKEVRRTSVRRLKPLKPLRNVSSGKNVSTSGTGGSGGNSADLTNDEDMKKTFLSPKTEAKITVNISHGKRPKKILKRKLEPQIVPERHNYASKVQRLTARWGNGSVGSTFPEKPRKEDFNEPSVSEEECPESLIQEKSDKKDLARSITCETRPKISSVKKKIEEKDIGRSAFGNESAPSTDEETSRANVFNESGPEKLLEKKEVGLDRESKQYNVRQQVSGRPAQAMEKPVKKIKLKRVGLMKARTVDDIAGKPRFLSSALGRKITVNRNKPVKKGKDTVEKPFTEAIDVTTTKWNNIPVNSNEETSFSKRDQEKQCILTHNPQEYSNSMDIHSISTSHRVKPFDSIVPSGHRSRQLQTAAGGSLLREKSEVSKLSNHSRAAMKLEKALVLPTDPHPHDVKELRSEVTWQRKSSLHQLVKEVSDDIKDEEEDFLDEALEKAIAELSPAPTDDEEEVTNDDDLLLEIEEMINS